MVKVGNHKSSQYQENIKTLTSVLEKEFKMLWYLPLSINTLEDIHDTVVVMLVIEEQLFID